MKKKNIWNKDGTLTDFGDEVRAHLVRAAGLVLTRYEKHLDGPGLRHLEGLWHHTIPLQVALVMMRRQSKKTNLLRPPRKARRG